MRLLTVYTVLYDIASPRHLHITTLYKVSNPALQIGSDNFSPVQDNDTSPTNLSTRRRRIQVGGPARKLISSGKLQLNFLGSITQPQYTNFARYDSTDAHQVTRIRHRVATPSRVSSLSKHRDELHHTTQDQESTNTTRRGNHNQLPRPHTRSIPFLSAHPRAWYSRTNRLCTATMLAQPGRRADGRPRTLRAAHRPDDVLSIPGRAGRRPGYCLC